ncbi:hypothetical protein [Marinobacter nauticus]|uniref:DUF87 domain-containing protein n=1 Tax=Marinobacter nauticus TaxID=2743 RepID=A0A1M2UXB9_MARNT|nr:hypothetical protein [Marinobacter nauticus]OJS99988.1 hypothetical protein BEE62_07700 [Marinobacter nauticus]
MSLKNEPLLVFKGVNAKPMHGRYAEPCTEAGAPSAIHEGMEKSVVITFDDANRHLLALGATGARKTTTCLAAAVAKLVKEHCSGLVVDVKGEYRHMADLHPDRVVVIGADDDAAPYNLIEGMSDEQFSSFLQEIMPRVKEPYWGSQGIKDACFIRKVYQLMGEEATLANIVEALAAPARFVKVADSVIMSRATLPTDFQLLLEAVTANSFSILARGGSSLLDEDAPSMDEVQKQYTWHTAGLIKVLSPFSSNTSLREKFSPDPDSWERLGKEPLPSMENLLYRDRKVLVLDLPLDQFGNTAHIVSKLLRVRMISAITGFRDHKRIGCGDSFYTFFAADEYQHLVNIDQEAATGGLFDDTTFFDRCRGYGHINLIATQSVSALRAKVNSSSGDRGLDCLLQNIGTVVVFSSSDPATDALLRGRVSAVDAEQISSIVRSDLPPGEAYVVGRSMARHGGSTLVTRVKGSEIPGQEHMSRYFAGMPDPIRPVIYSAEPEYVVNPHFKKEAANALPGGLWALKAYFMRRKQTILEELECEQVYNKDFSPREVSVFMEDEDFVVALQGCMGGYYPTLWQRYLNLLITKKGADGWQCEVPMCAVMPLVEAKMIPGDRHRLRRKLTGFEMMSRQPRNVDREAEIEEIEIKGDGDLYGADSTDDVSFCAGSMHTKLSKRYWNEICKALGHLESEYSQVCFDTLEQEADPFDVFFDDE